MHNHSNGNKWRILMQIKLISLSIVEHQDSLRHRNKQQLGNGLLVGRVSGQNDSKEVCYPVVAIFSTECISVSLYSVVQSKWRLALPNTAIKGDDADRKLSQISKEDSPFGI